MLVCLGNVDVVETAACVEGGLCNELMRVRGSLKVLGEAAAVLVKKVIVEVTSDDDGASRMVVLKVLEVRCDDLYGSALPTRSVRVPVDAQNNHRMRWPEHDGVDVMLVCVIHEDLGRP